MKRLIAAYAVVLIAGWGVSLPAAAAADGLGVVWPKASLRAAADDSAPETECAPSWWRGADLVLPPHGYCVDADGAGSLPPRETLSVIRVLLPMTANNCEGGDAQAEGTADEGAALGTDLDGSSSAASATDSVAADTGDGSDAQGDALADDGVDSDTVSDGCVGSASTTDCTADSVAADTGDGSDAQSDATPASTAPVLAAECPQPANLSCPEESVLGDSAGDGPPTCLDPDGEELRQLPVFLDQFQGIHCCFGCPHRFGPLRLDTYVIVSVASAGNSMAAALPPGLAWRRARIEPPSR